MKRWAERQIKEGELASRIVNELRAYEGLEAKEERNIVSQVLRIEHKEVEEIGKLPFDQTQEERELEAAA